MGLPPKWIETGHCCQHVKNSGHSVHCTVQRTQMTPCVKNGTCQEKISQPSTDNRYGVHKLMLVKTGFQSSLNFVLIVCE